ncbi:MFS transporter [Pararhizobium sp.]|uniref:MFS transporter n=1 Tax=Pararhizobium sp. TaxID=1977563 RepID=UPI00271D37A3|nr:MFS transporter [Pararhizobium sp.]MDO9416310.1 MFS transporter [Pararhizobium sp.]
MSIDLQVSPATAAAHKSVFGRETALAFYALALGTFLAASSAPTPLYRLYQHDWGFSSVMLTLIFSVYAFSLLISIVIVGSLSDHIGRRPVIFAAILGQGLALLLFLLAEGPGWLMAARIVQGLATGAATSAIGAALVDSNPARGAIVNSIAPLVGMAIGALGCSILVAYAPEPMRLVYGLLLAAILVQAAMVWLMPETAIRQPGAWASLKPTVHVPVNARRSLLLITPLNVSIWALGGFYLSLVPSLVSASTGIVSPLIGGLVVATLTLSGAAAVFLMRQKPVRLPLTLGPLTTIAGVLTLMAGVHTGLVALLFAGTAIAGTGFGASFLGCVRTIMPLAKPDERAGLLSAFYTESYLAFSIPAILAGVLAHEIGLPAATDVYAAFILLLTVSGLVALKRAGLLSTSVV